MRYLFFVPCKVAKLSYRLKDSLKIKLSPVKLLMMSLCFLSPFSLAYSDNKSQQNKEVVLNTLTLASAIKKTLNDNPSLKVFEFRQRAIEGQLQSQHLKPAYETGVSHSRNSQLIAMRKIKALNLLSEVARRYIDVLAAQARLSLAKEATALAEETLSEVEKRAKAGVAPEAEIKRALAALGNARLVTSSEQQQFDYAKVFLAMMWKETTAEFESVEGNLFQFSKDVAFEKLYTKVKQNPEILVYAAQERLRDAQLRLARTESSADIKWSVGIKQIQALNDTALTAGFTMPLYSSQRNTGAIISAQAARDEVNYKREEKLLALHNQLYRAYSNRKQAIFTALNLKDSIIPTLTEALKETQIAYQRGRYSYLDYLSARQELLFARRAIIESATAALRYGIEIEQLIAEPLPASQHNFTSQLNDEF